jgi:uncharacterized protein (TIGR03382 family)
MRTLALTAIVVASCALLPSRAHAYDHKHTHRWLTRAAAMHLVRAYPGQYDELLTYLDAVAEGAEHEDDLILDGDTDPFTMRVMRHFMRPTDGAGLTMEGFGTFPSSFEWAMVSTEGNAWDWQDGLDAYRRLEVREAYFVLGHMVHLIQDLTVPAHTHLDVHGPPSGDDYESYCTSRTPDEFTSSLPLPRADAPVPEFADAREAWNATARASYYRNRYSGDLSDDEHPGGVITEMFPAIGYSWLAGDWSIDEPAVGKLGEGFMEREPGYFYFKATRFPAAIDVGTYDPADPYRRTYAANPEGRPMTELLARDLIPVAVLHSAGLMKLYLDQAYAQPTIDPAADDEPDAEEPMGCSSTGGAGGWVALLFVLLPLLARRKRCA